MSGLDGTFAVVAACVLAGFATEALAGFGAILVALALAANVVPVEDLLPVVVPASLIVTVYIVLRHGARADRALLVGRVLPLTGLGLAVGLAALPRVEGAALRTAFGAGVAAFAAWELRRASRGAAAQSRGGAPASAAATRGARAALAVPLMLAAGVVHGLLACGGPLLVLALGRLGLDRGAFRSTLAPVWLALNASLTFAYAASGRLGAPALGRIAALVPVAALAIALGEWAHARIDERRFRILVFAVLIAAGGALAFREARGLRPPSGDCAPHGEAERPPKREEEARARVGPGEVGPEPRGGPGPRGGDRRSSDLGQKKKEGGAGPPGASRARPTQARPRSDRPDGEQAAGRGVRWMSKQTLVK